MRSKPHPPARDAAESGDRRTKTYFENFKLVILCSFCSDQHRALHEDRGQCLPFLVTFKEGVGRCVVAARDIAPGELIFREEALVIGPNHDTPPLCLSCLKVVNDQPRGMMTNNE